jgi:ribulose-5-phosphate 4-epimerase/fuculose-1-phosphate aldolase
MDQDTTGRDPKHLPRPPKFESLKLERDFRLARLATVFRVFHTLGFAHAGAGHVTVRDPEEPDLFWVNSLGVSFARIAVHDLLQVDGDGAIVSGNGVLSRPAFAIHSAIHRARPDVVAAAHAHALHGTTFASLGRPLDPITQDACAFYEDHVVYDEYDGVVLDASYGERLGHAFGDGKAMIHQNHGLITVGKTVDEAAWWLVALERSCRIQLLAEAAGKPTVIPSDVARETGRLSGSHYSGWLAYQLLLEELDIPGSLLVPSEAR